MTFIKKYIPALILFLGLILPCVTYGETRVSNLYGSVPNATVGGKEVDLIYNVIFYLTTVVFVLVNAVFIYYLVRYRRRPGVKAHYSHGSNSLELFWTTIPAIIFIVLAFWSNRVWFDLHRTPPEDSLRIDIVSYQFGWDMRYPGKDMVLGNATAMGFTPDNRFGVDKDDAAGNDDFVTTELVIPANRPVHVYLRSRDVIHSFYVPEFRVYQDAVPGRTIGWVWFEVMHPGNFELACSQLCGTGHYNMKAPIKVLPPEEFDKWYAEKSQAALDKAASAKSETEKSENADTAQKSESAPAAQG
ncbi:MAG: cytochrome c oxidase subunit II [Chthoniobacterales bacterium]